MTQEEAEWEIAEYLLKHKDGLKEKFKDYVQEQIENGIGEIGISKRQFSARVKRLATGLLQQELMDRTTLGPEWIISIADETYITNLLGEGYFDYYS